MKSWLAQGSSGRRVILLPGTTFLHINGAQWISVTAILIFVQRTGKINGELWIKLWLWKADYELLTEGSRIRGENRKDLVELRYFFFFFYF